MHQRNRLIGTSRLVVRAATLVNRIFLIAVLLGMAASIIFTSNFAALLIQPDPGVDMASALTGLRFELLIGIVMAVATDRLLTNLGHIIASTRAGDPFHAANARRLQTIGWALLVLQLLDIPGALLGRAYPGLGSAAPGGDFSAGGWVAVLMVFVLSRIFAAGAEMREELAGTI